MDLPLKTKKKKKKKKNQHTLDAYITGSLAGWVECFNPRSRHTKDFKNGTRYLLA